MLTPYHGVAKGSIANALFECFAILMLYEHQNKTHALNSIPILCKLNDLPSKFLYLLKIISIS